MQAFDNRLMDAEDGADVTTGGIQCGERLGTMLEYYYRDVA